MKEAAHPQIALLLALLDEAYDKKAWHGPNLRGAIRRLSAAEAGWRPNRGRHSIVDIVVHVAYWKYAVRRRLRGDKRGTFPLAGTNWFALPVVLTEEIWRGYLCLLDEQHRALREAVAEFPESRLHRPSPGSKFVAAQLIYGIAAHDVYHAGQIQLLKRLQQATADSMPRPASARLEAPLALRRAKPRSPRAT
jgi:uncharacterized damage-inducible protein DinB